MLEKPYQINASWVDDPSTFLKDGPRDGIRVFTDPWEFILTINRQRYVITVPVGWQTDGPSIPAGFRWAVPYNNQTGPAGYIHDAIYGRQGVFNVVDLDGSEAGRILQITRYQADSLFHLACLKMELARWRANIAARVLLLFGWVAWHAESKTDRNNYNLTITATHLS